MPLTTDTRSGLSTAFTSIGGTNRFANGYPLYYSPDAVGPQGTINQSIAGKSLQAMYFPTDLPKMHFNIIENTFARTGNIFGQGALNIPLTPVKLIKLQLPTPIVEQHEINYDQNFNYLGILDRLKNIGIVQAASAALGVQLNTFKTVTMSAPDYRTFQFTWKFSPKTHEESRTIQKILTALKRASLPQRAAGKFVLSFPQIFSLSFSPNPKFLYKFKPCVLTSISIDYSGGNPFPSFYRQENTPENTAPESITLSTSWLELEYWLGELGNQGTGKDIVLDTADPGMPTNDPYDAWNFYTYNNGPAPAVPAPKAEDKQDLYKRPRDGQLGEE